ncbi:VrrA/YqfQ family protein [Amphibacillus indicireducens]|uniref:YqfQ-like protein n=1 Tax=Amphibacillus indicireducens TaxID=1076330 RepID=A0ABP7VPI3_9BACI
MKQMPAFFNPQFPIQQTRAMMPPWGGYQPIAQQAIQQTVTPGLTTNSSSSSGLLGLLKKLNPSGGSLFETLDKIQGFLKMSQSIAPKIQEYGPLIKNLPTMLALMKEFSDEEESEETDDNRLATEDDSTDELDRILALDVVEDKQLSAKEEQKQPNQTKQDKDQGNNLFKIETVSAYVKPKYDQPMLFI